MTDFDYKKYSLENLEKWMSDALLSSEATPREIYDIIRGVVHEEYHYFKHQTGRCYELLALLGGTNNLQEQVKAQGDVWDKEDVGAILAEREYYEPSMTPWGHSDMEALRYTEEELNAMCDKAASDDEKNKCREYNLREAEYYNKRAELDTIAQKVKEVGGYDWSPLPQKDKVVKWQLPVEIDGTSGEYYIQFPDDLMEASGIRENDMVEWIDLKNGSFELRKVNGPK